jgi:beta-glucanase (GH16 family)
MPTERPEHPPSFVVKHKYYHTILYEYVLGRAYKVWSIGWVMVGLLQPPVPLFYQIFNTRTIEMPTEWPGLSPSFGARHEYYHTIP